MEKIQEQLWVVAKEIARQFGEVIGMEPEFWVGDTPDLCCFSDSMFFSLEEMRQVLERLPKYVERYGSKEAVGEEINAWVDWWLEDSHDSVERIGRRVTYQLRPNINLESWLNGCPREERKPWSGPDCDWMRLQNRRDVLKELIEEYGPDNELKNVLEGVEYALSREDEAKKNRDHEEFVRMMASPAGQEFQKTVEDCNGDAAY